MHLQDCAIYLSTSSLTYSFRFNPRLLEDVTHPLWTFNSSEASQKYKLFPTAQFKIYVSENDVPDNASYKSDATSPDSTARGITTDFALILPVFKNTPYMTPEAVSGLTGDKKWSPRDWFTFLGQIELSHLLVPLLTELKKPVTRSAEDIFQYVKCISYRMRIARLQVIDQAWCLFSSVRFAEQDEVVLKVGAGEWWSFCLVTREEMREHKENKSFAMKAFDRTAGTMDRLEMMARADIVEHDEPHHEDEIVETYDNVKETALSRDSMEVIYGRIERKKNKELQAEQRRARILARNLMQEQAKQGGGPAAKTKDTEKTEYQKLKSVKAGYYTDEQLRKFYELAKRYQPIVGEWKIALQFKSSDDGKDHDIETYRNLAWSPVTRLGSEISDLWESVISMHLDQVVKNEEKKVSEVYDRLDDKVTETIKSMGLTDLDLSDEDYDEDDKGDEDYEYESDNDPGAL